MLDFTKVLKEFNKRNIKYIVAGGIAVNLHGIPRMTYDLDLLLDMNDENLKKFLKIMKKWGYKPNIPVDIMDFACEEKRNDWINNKNMKAFCLRNDNNTVREIDIIVESPVTYESAEKNAEYVELENEKIPVVNIRDLIKMKKITGRKQDDSDIRYLEEKLNGK